MIPKVIINIKINILIRICDYASKNIYVGYFLLKNNFKRLIILDSFQFVQIIRN